MILTCAMGNMHPTMDLKTYYTSLKKHEKADFARRCETTKGYLANAICRGKRPETAFAIRLHRESGGVVDLESLVPGADWDYVRQQEKKKAPRKRPSSSATPRQ